MQSLTTLIAESSSRFLRRLMPILILAIVFGLFLGALEQTFSQQTEQSARSVLKELGFDDLKLQQLQQRVEQGDTQAIQEFTAEMQKRFQPQGTDPLSTLVMREIMTTIRRFLWYYPMLWLLMTLFTLPIILLSIAEREGLAVILLRSMRKAPPFLALSLWVVLRSFIWLFPIGFFIAIVLGPRLALTPVIFLAEGKGVLESARESLRRTAGQWSVVTTNIFLASLGAGVIVMLLHFFSALGSPTIAMYLQSIITALGAAFMTVFLVRFSEEFRGNERPRTLNAR